MRLQNFVIGLQTLSLDHKFCYYKDYRYFETENFSRGMDLRGHLSHSSPMGQHVLLWDYKICHKDHTYFVYGTAKQKTWAEHDLRGRVCIWITVSPMDSMFCYDNYKDFVMGLQNLTSKKCQVHLKREIRPKRDIVDTYFHASCAFGHNPILGLPFSYLWEMVRQGNWTSDAYYHWYSECLIEPCWSSVHYMLIELHWSEDVQSTLGLVHSDLGGRAGILLWDFVYGLQILNWVEFCYGDFCLWDYKIWIGLNSGCHFRAGILNPLQRLNLLWDYKVCYWTTNNLLIWTKFVVGTTKFVMDHKYFVYGDYKTQGWLESQFMFCYGHHIRILLWDYKAWSIQKVLSPLETRN